MWVTVARLLFYCCYSFSEVKVPCAGDKTSWNLSVFVWWRWRCRIHCERCTIRDKPQPRLFTMHTHAHYRKQPHSIWLDSIIYCVYPQCTTQFQLQLTIQTVTCSTTHSYSTSACSKRKIHLKFFHATLCVVVATIVIVVLDCRCVLSLSFSIHAMAVLSVYNSTHIHSTSLEIWGTTSNWFYYCYRVETISNCWMKTAIIIIDCGISFRTHKDNAGWL